MSDGRTCLMRDRSSLFSEASSANLTSMIILDFVKNAFHQSSDIKPETPDYIVLSQYLVLFWLASLPTYHLYINVFLARVPREGTISHYSLIYLALVFWGLIWVVSRRIFPLAAFTFGGIILAFSAFFAKEGNGAFFLGLLVLCIIVCHGRHRMHVHGRVGLHKLVRDAVALLVCSAVMIYWIAMVGHLAGIYSLQKAGYAEMLYGLFDLAVYNASFGYFELCRKIADSYGWNGTVLAYALPAVFACSYFGVAGVQDFIAKLRASGEGLQELQAHLGG